jgi:hypothetical protein
MLLSPSPKTQHDTLPDPKASDRVFYSEGTANIFYIVQKKSAPRLKKQVKSLFLRSYQLVFHPLTLGFWDQNNL